MYGSISRNSSPALGSSGYGTTRCTFSASWANSEAARRYPAPPRPGLRSLLVQTLRARQIGRFEEKVRYALDVRTVMGVRRTRVTATGGKETPRPCGRQSGFSPGS